MAFRSTNISPENISKSLSVMKNGFQSQLKMWKNVWSISVPETLDSGLPVCKDLHCYLWPMLII